MNTNCLKGLSCPHCKQDESLMIKISGVIAGTGESSQIWVLMDDDGFDDVLCDGDTEWDDESEAKCPDCKFKALVGEFRR